MIRSFSIFALLLIVCLFSTVASAAEWGTLSGRFVYVGTAPTPPKLDISKDKEVCGKHNLVDESLLVGKDNGIANMVVFVRAKQGQKLAVNPEYEKTATDTVTLNNHDCHFEPHVLAVRVNQPFVIGNLDPVGHNSKVDPNTNPPANPLIAAGTSFADYKFTSPEAMPVPVSCNIHPWMKAYVVVRPDPYVGISGEDGSFQIKDLPVGDLEFQVCHEGDAVTKVDVDGKATTWARGRFTRKIVAGDNKMGDIKITAADLEKK